MKRKILKPNTRVRRNGIEASVVSDTGGAKLTVIQDGSDALVAWSWKQGRTTLKVIAEPEPRTYEEVVEELTNRIYDNTDLEAFKDVVENGLVGVRQMSNEQLAQEWLIQLGAPLEITDPESNPYLPSLEERLAR